MFKAIVLKEAEMLTVLALLLVGNAVTAQSPELTSSHYGQVTIETSGDVVPEGTPIVSVIGGVDYEETRVFVSGEGTVFRIDVPGDVFATPEIEGGREGQIVVFKVGNAEANETAIWQHGSVTRLDLTVPVGPDLALSKDDGTADVLPGQTLDYTLTVTNPDATGGTGVVLEDVLPANTVFVGASHGGTESDGNVTWPPFDLPAGTSATRTLTLEVASDVNAGTEIANTATVEDDGTAGMDPDPSNNTAADVDTVAAPDLAVLSVGTGQTTTDPQSLAISGLVGVEIRNQGNADAGAFDVVVFEDFDGDAVFDPAVDNHLGQGHLAGGIVAGQTVLLDVPVGGTVLFRGNLLHAFADSTAAVAELDETNNLGHTAGACADPTGAPAPDLTASQLAVDLDAYPSRTFTVRIGNGGAAVAEAGLPVAFYDADPAADPPAATLLGVAGLTTPLDPGELEDVALTVELAALGPAEVWAVAGDDGTGGTALDDCNGANNQHHLAYDTEPLGLALTKDDGTAAVHAGTSTTYVLTIANGSGLARTGIALSDLLPPYTALAAASDGGAETAGTVDWPAFDLPAWSAAVRTLTVVVDADLPPEVASLTNTATVTDDGAAGPDPSPENNTASDVNTVLTVRADAGGPYGGTEGSAIALDASGSSDRDGTIVSYEWDLDADGAFDDATGVATSHVFGDDGAFTVAVRVTDDSGESDTASAELTVANVAPVVDAGPDQLLTATMTAVLGPATYHDPGVVDTHTATIDWGDGTVEDATAASGTVAGSHAYAANGTYAAAVCVTDDDGGRGCDQLTVTVFVVPDLVAEAVDASQVTANAQTLETAGTVTATIRNTGAVATDTGFDVVFFSDQNASGQFEPGADLVLAEGAANPLAAQSELAINAEVSYTAPFAASPIYVMADAGGAVVELDESNNTAHSGAACAADVTASFIRFEDPACPSELTVAARIGNAGAGLVPAMPSAFYNGDPAAGGSLLGVVPGSSLGPGQFEDVRLLVDAVAPPAIVCVAADDDGTGTGTLGECEETNNLVCAAVANPCSVQSADLEVTKTDGETTVYSGSALTYTIRVVNHGPADVTGATVSDAVPALLVDPTWTCAAAGGASCTAGPVSGSIADTVDLPAGSSVTYLLSAATDPAATGTLTNTVTVASPVPDPSPGNESATDTTDLVLLPELSVADLAVTEGSGPEGTWVEAIFTVTLSEPSTGIASFDLLTGDGSAVAGVDYVSAEGHDFFEVGETVRTVMIPVLSDTVHEADETFVLRLTNVVGAHLVDAEAVCTILDDDDGIDLIVSEVDLEQVVTDPHTLAVSGQALAVIRNAGPAPVSSELEVLFFADGNASGWFEPGSDQILGQETVVVNLAAEEEVAVSTSLDYTASFAGDLVYVFADSADVVAEVDETNNVEHSGAGCEYRPPTGGLDPVLEWSWTGSPVEPSFAGVISTPVVADVDGDGVADVLFVTHNDSDAGLPAILRAVSGRDGASIFDLTDPDYRLQHGSQLAVGDIDGDSLPEIVAVRKSPSGILALEHTGEVKWFRPGLSPRLGGAAIANLDGVGLPEIVVGAAVLEADGTVRWQVDPWAGGIYQSGGMSIVVDLDLDGGAEIVAGGRAWNHDGTLFFDSGLGDMGFTASGDFDGDPHPEIVLVRDGWVWLLEHTGELVWSIRPAGLGIGGPPTVADFDGDALPEVGVAGGSRYVVLDTDGQPLWSASTQDGSSSVTGSAVFDLEGDGAAEVLYGDEVFFRIFRGSDGAVLFETPNPSCTGYENPVVADVDNDGNAEIVVVRNQLCGFGNQTGVFNEGIFVFGDAADNWVDARAVWNQHTYHVTNVNDDLSIPTSEVPNWLQPGLNNYRTQVAVEGNPFAAPDLTASLLRIDCAALGKITVRVGNAGANVAAAPLDVAFYRGDPAAGATLVAVVATTANLPPGAFEDVTLELTPPLQGTELICVVADDDGAGVGAANECRESNNLTCLDLAALCPPPPPNADAGGPYGADEGSEVTFDASASDGAIVLYEWDLDGDGAFDDGLGASASRVFDDNGTFTVAVRVSDEHGASDTASAEVTVANLPPVVDAAAGRTVIEGGAETFEIATFTDPGTADSHTATISWGDGTHGAGEVSEFQGAGTVTGGHVYPEDGTFTVEVCVSDDEGAEACGQLTLTVDNAAPVVIDDIAGMEIFEGEAAEVELGFRDAGREDTHTATLDWQDGVVEPGVVTGGLGGEILLADSFDEENGGRGRLNYTDFANWTVIDGSVDLIGNGFYDFLPGNGLYLDLDGSTLDAGTLRTRAPLTLTPGGYELRFELAGSHRHYRNDIVVVRVGTLFEESFTFDPYQPFTTIVRRLTVTSTVSVDLVFEHMGGDYVGLLLDDVVLQTACPLGVGSCGTVTGWHVFADDGSYDVDVCVTDDDGGTGCGTFPVTVRNLPPAVDAGADLTVPFGSAAAVAATFVDAGILDTHSATIDWGDGTTNAAAVSESGGSGTAAGSHVYAAAGTFDVAVCVTDDDGDSGCDSLAVVVEELVEPDVSISDATVTEGTGITVVAELAVTLTRASGKEIQVSYASADGTALAGADYTTSSGTVTFAPGITARTVSVPLIGDAVDELDESFTVALSSPLNAAIADGEGTVTIIDDDEAGISIDDVEIGESDAGSVDAVFTVGLSTPSDREIRVGYETAALTATAGEDYLAVSGTLVFAAGTTAQTLAVGIVGDVVLEDDETFLVELSDPVEAVIGDGTAVGTILDDEVCAGPNLLVNPGAERRGAGGAIAGWIHLEGAWQRRFAPPDPIDGKVTFFAGTADYAELYQDVDVRAYGTRIAAGSQAFAFDGFVRTFDESPPDVVRVVVEYRDLSNAAALAAWDSGQIASPFAWTPVSDLSVAPAGTGWIRVRLVATRFAGEDADAFVDALSLRSLRAPTLVVDDVAVYEEAGPAVFTVELSCAWEHRVDVDFATADDTALEPGDYHATGGSLGFPTGVTSRTISVPIVDDDADEPHETFLVELDNLVSAGEVVLLDAIGAGTIRNDDFCPRSHGYWKKDTERWPTDWLELGGVEYELEELMAFLTYKGPDASNHLALQLVATKLNLERGGYPIILPVVEEADVFLELYPPGTNPRGAARDAAHAIKNELDAYNNTECPEEDTTP